MSDSMGDLNASFAEYVSAERRRLDGERQAWLDSRRECEENLAAIDREFAAIEAYEAAKFGKAQAPARAASADKRVRHGSRRGALLTLIGAATDGMSRGEILDRMGLKGDKSGEMSVSNALTNLIKRGQIERHDGRYFIPVGRGDTVSYQQDPAVEVYEAAE